MLVPVGGAYEGLRDRGLLKPSVSAFGGTDSRRNQRMPQTIRPPEGIADQGENGASGGAVRGTHGRRKGRQTNLRTARASARVSGEGCMIRTVIARSKTKQHEVTIEARGEMNDGDMVSGGSGHRHDLANNLPRGMCAGTNQGCYRPLN